MTVILILIEINLVLLVKFRLVCFHAGRTLNMAYYESSVQEFHTPKEKKISTQAKRTKNLYSKVNQTINFCQ